MRPNRSFAVLAVVALTLGSAAIAMQPTTAPADAESSATTKPTGRARPVRLTAPWNKIADLTDEQKSQINAIHVETVAKVKALEAEEDEKCMALLTDEQRKALEETLEQEKVARKAKAGKKE